ncbi:MAG: transcriptional regulator [Stutzerimonas stutzeri]|nr:MAG: transcriptional regulator [Stutzerimonas stutzeri]
MGMSKNGHGSPSEIGRFLRMRREALRPDDLGLTSSGRRRVPGLRRSEVAERAGVGIDWYTALEQGRDVRASEHVLSRLAAALLLNPAERDHLYALAGRAPVVRRPDAKSEVSPTIRRIIARMSPSPAYALSAAWDALAWNDSAAELFGLDGDDSNYPCNLLWTTFVARARPRDQHWEYLTEYFLRAFRRQAAAFADEPRIAQLVADLNRESPQFRKLWSKSDIRDTKGGSKQLVHPTAGLVTYEFAALGIPEIPGAHLFVYLEDGKDPFL